jgi:hypothetical protein
MFTFAIDLMFVGLPLIKQWLAYKMPAPATTVISCMTEHCRHLHATAWRDSYRDLLTAGRGFTGWSLMSSELLMNRSRLRVLCVAGRGLSPPREDSPIGWVNGRRNGVHSARNTRADSGHSPITVYAQIMRLLLTSHSDERAARPCCRYVISSTSTSFERTK